MFGMEKKGKKKGNVQEWEFDLEKQVANPGEKKKIKETMDQRILQLKTILRQGEDKKTFDDAQTLLHGYLAVQKVIQRIGSK
jgi:hypothetical protein